MKKESKVVKLPRKMAVVEAEAPPPEDLVGTAKYLEKKGALKEAARIYEKLVKKETLKENTYSRLMMIYRKQKDFKNELRVINSGIKTFQDFYMPSAVGKHRAIISLSKKLNVLIGLTDSKGRSLAEAEPIKKWRKRKEVVLKKIADQKRRGG